MIARNCGNRGGCRDIEEHAHRRRRREATAKHSFRPIRHSLTSTLRLYLVLVVLATFVLGVVAGDGTGEAEIGLGRWRDADTRAHLKVERLVRRADTLHHTSVDLPFSTTTTVTTTTTTTPTKTSTDMSLSGRTSIISTTTTAIPTTTAGSTTKADTTTTEISTAVVTDAAGPTEIPVPFDSISLTPLNMTADCAEFLTYVLSDPNFQGCIPLSGLLRDSLGFFDIMSKGAFATTALMDRVCNVDLNACTAVMETYGGQLRKESFCKDDFNKGNPVVVNVFTALVAYRPLYSAGCLKAKDGDYCFVDAVTNTSSPEDLFIYSLPLGTRLPGGARPTCSECLAETMKIFGASAGNTTQPVSQTYIPASEQLNMACGPGFANTSVITVDSAASSRSPRDHVAGVAVAATAAAAALLFL